MSEKEGDRSGMPQRGKSIAKEGGKQREVR